MPGYTVEVVAKGITFVVSVHGTPAEARQALRGTEGLAVVRTASGRILATTLARTSQGAHRA